MPLVKIAALLLAASPAIYLAILSLLIALPVVQNHVFYLHRLSLASLPHLNVPEAFGFLRGQVTPFSIDTADGEMLHAWHVLPLGIYQHHQQELLVEPSGYAADMHSKLGFQLLRDDLEARLVIFLHGTAGCIASGRRPDSYRALSSTSPDKIHVLTADYRGYGLSTGTPSEEGLLLDAIAIVDWAMNTAGIPPSRIVIFGQSLGTAVAISLLQHFSSQSPPTSFSGTVLVATFSDVATLTSTYRIGGVIPVLSPLSTLPPLLSFVTSYLRNTWPSNHRVADFIRRSEIGDSGSKYHLTFIHAEDDAVIGHAHSAVMFWHAVNASTSAGITFDELEREKSVRKRDMGEGGWAVDWETPGGSIGLQLLKYGVHDRLMAYPATAMAVLRAFQAGDAGFGR
ncbi:Monoacylglycerol lipase ABHD12 [Diplodia seriata]|uniref:Monoacylglycerol lipase ABHD12 n=1 Tax=Diplodia seriata TaxID=420778 RepID=A0A1S8B529_9PEZI|nr:Monoacylglycerol lipase ABHD12 [Diplodia seriata]